MEEKNEINLKENSFHYEIETHLLVPSTTGVLHLAVNTHQLKVSILCICKVWLHGNCLRFFCSYLKKAASLS